MDDATPTPDPALGAATEALARSRAAEQAARDRGSPYGIALARTQAGHALLGLGRADEAVAEFDESLRYVSLIRTEGSHEMQRLLRISSASAPPPDADTGDLGLLEAWAAVGRAAALAQAGRRPEAAAAVAAARPLTKGWRRRSLRRALDEVEAGLAPVAAPPSAPGGGSAGGSGAGIGTGADGPGPAAGTSGTPGPEAGSLADRYEVAAALVEQGRVAEGARAALLLVRDADAAGDARLVAAARQTLGAALAAGGLGPDGAGEEATRTLRAAFDGFVALGDDRTVTAAAPGLAQRLVDEGQPTGAVEVLERAHAAALHLGDEAAQADLLTALIAARDAAGDTAGALAAAEEATAAAESLGDAVRVADARHGEAVVRAVHLAADPDHLVEALSLLDAARDAYAAADHPDRAAGCDHEAAALLARAGSYDAAAGRYRAAEQAYLSLPADRRDAGSWPDEVADCARNLALLAALAGDPTRPVPDGAFASGGHGMSRRN